ncbi:endonuclease/reverse transcriptase [Blumeria hordei DH14]|uniref:Endonuclease/reverse transcriptase n=1 Tax=Blumeria graminis f. sp. hordei (strain DH14) TaxID=546991 RepID=N1JF69_BLUG1|nr:endonuclease/reverse transcriptase [Blumeria hordei DH14]
MTLLKTKPSVPFNASRAREAQNLFGSLARLLDEYCSSHARAILPESQAQALHNCTSELATIAAKHFNAYMHGTSNIEDPCPVKTAKVNAPQSYADDRLFVRLSSNSPLRTASGYAIQTHLKSKLGRQSQLLSSAMSTKTGFALRPSAGNADALNEKLATVDLFGTAPIEKSSPWTSYWIENRVTIEAVTAAVASAASATPVSVLASQDNETNPDSPDTSWIVRFPQDHSRLSCILYLFGCRTVNRILPKRSRACSSATRCRLCGSTQHTEKDHNNLCAAPAGHIYPWRCIHCHGPHPADDPTCELRPQPSNPPKIKSQVIDIRRIFSGACIRCQVEAGCVKPSETMQGISTSHSVHHTSYPALSQGAGPSRIAAAAKRTLFLNPFEILKTSAGASDDQMEL